MSQLCLLSSTSEGVGIAEEDLRVVLAGGIKVCSPVGTGGEGRLTLDLGANELPSDQNEGNPSTKRDEGEPQL